MKDSILIVMAHGGAQKTFDRHLPHWEAMGLPMLVAMPGDDPVATSLPSLVTGDSSHCGPKAAARLKRTIKAFLDTRKQRAFIFEYDCLFIGSPAEFDNYGLYGLTGVMHRNRERSRFRTNEYLVVPWCLDRYAAWSIYHAAEDYPDIIEEGYHDRLISAWAEIANVHFFEYMPPGFAENTITPDYYPEMRKKIKQGCNWVHGIKTEEALKVVLEAKAARK